MSAKTACARIGRVTKTEERLGRLDRSIISIYNQIHDRLNANGWEA